MHTALLLVSLAALTASCSGSGDSESPDPAPECFDSVAIEEFPASLAGDTSSSEDSISLPGDTCGFFLARGSGVGDDVYGFRATESKTYSVAMDADFDAVVYVFSDCGDPAQSCIAGEDDLFDGNEAFNFDVVEEQTYYLVVDGWADVNIGVTSGTYDLEIKEVSDDDGA